MSARAAMYSSSASRITSASRRRSWRQCARCPASASGQVTSSSPYVRMVALQRCGARRPFMPSDRTSRDDPRLARIAAPARRRARPPRASSRKPGARRAPAGRRSTGASRSSARGSPPGSRTARSPRGRTARLGAGGRTRRDEGASRSAMPSATGSGAAQTAKTIAARFARATAGRGRSEGSGPRARLQRTRVADHELRVGLLAERHVVGVGQQHAREHHRGSRSSGVIATVRTCASGLRDTS